MNAWKLRLLRVLFLLILCAGTAFAEFSDDCASPQSDDWHIYQNLMATQNNAAVDLDWPTAPDRTALSVANPQTGPAAALYAVEGASGLELSLYSMYATFVTPYAGRWVQGIPVGNSISGAKRLLISPSSGRVYLNAGGWFVHERDAYGDFVFQPLASPPTEQLEAYGLTVLCSPDGQRFTQAAVTLRSVRSAAAERSGFPCYYESYSVSVPAGTRFIRVELREMGAFYLSGGGTQGNTARGSLRLASVRFLGNAVRGSFSAPPSSSDASSSQSSVSSDPDLQQPSSSRPTTGGGNAGGTPDRSSSSSRTAKSQSSSAAAPKSSTKGASTASSRASSASARPAPSASSKQASESEEPTAAPPVREAFPEREQASRTGADTRTLLLGGGYILAASAALFFFARKK